MQTWTIHERRDIPAVSRRAYAPGALLIALALLTLALPQILVALVAAMLFTAGLAATSFAWKLRHTPGFQLEATRVEPMVDPWADFFRRM